jgi:O-antigen/teichoic acid export membrane protein
MLIGAAAAFAAQVIAARLLGSMHYGALSAALAAVGIVSPVVGFGVGPYWLRAFGLEGHAAQRWLPGSLRLVLATSVAGVGAVAAWAVASGVSPLTRSLTLALLPVAAVQGVYELAQARLQLEERYVALAWWLSVATVVLGIGGSAVGLAAGYSAAAIGVTLVGIASVIGMSRGRWTLAGHDAAPFSTPVAVQPGALGVARECWPFALGGLFYLIYYQSDIVLVAWMVNDKAAGIYQVAVVVVAGVYLLPAVVYQRYLLPKLHRWAEHNRGRFLSVYRYGCGMMSALGLVMGLVVALAGPTAVRLLFGQEYAGAGTALRILSLGVAAHHVATAVGGVLVTGPHMRKKVRYQGATALLNVGLNLLAVPYIGLLGAAASTAICEVCLAVMYLIAVRRHVFGPDAWRGWTLRYSEALT